MLSNNEIQTEESSFCNLDETGYRKYSLIQIILDFITYIQLNTNFAKFTIDQF